MTTKTPKRAYVVEHHAGDDYDVVRQEAGKGDARVAGYMTLAVATLLAKALNATPKYWACYLSTPSHGVNGISLHSTKDAAYREVAEYLLGEADETTELPEDTGALITWIHARVMDSNDGVDWYIAEVPIP